MTAASDTLRDEGMAQAEAAADARIIVAIDAVIERAIKSGRPFSANDIREHFPTVRSQGLVGARVKAASMRRPVQMVQTGKFPRSNLDGTKSARIAEWQGVVL